MLNLKKELALVLAAATAFTFAPVANLGVVANAAETDKYTAGDGIDSLTIKNLTVAKNADSSDILLKEHEDQSHKNPTPVAAFRIIIQQHQKDDGSYEDIVTAEDIATKKKKADGTTDNSIAESDTTSSQNIGYRQYMIANVPTSYKAGEDTTVENLNGASIRFKGVNAGSTTVTIQSLGAESEDADVLDESTLTVTVPAGNQNFKLTKSATTVKEGKDFTIPYVITNYDSTDKTITALSVKADQKSTLKLDSNGDPAIKSGATVTGPGAGKTTTTGTVTLTAGVAGTSTLTVYAKKASTDKDSDAVASATFDLTVVPANGKLSVTYDAVVPGQGIQTKTITDDEAFDTRTGYANSQFEKGTSSDISVDKDGILKLTTTLKTQQGTGYLLDKDGNTFQAYKTTAGANATPTADGSNKAKSLDQLKDGTEQAKVVYEMKGLGSTGYVASPLYADGQKTVQISASSDSNSTISYSLVANDGIRDAVADNATLASATKTEIKDVSSFTKIAAAAYAPTYNANGNATVAYSPKYITISGDYGPDSQVIYSVAKAAKYGSVSNTGLVTLKNADVPAGTSLYVIVTATPTAEQKANGQSVSTFAIPISLNTQQPATLYASDESLFSELDLTADGSTDAVKAENKIYMNLTDKKTNKMNIIANVGDAYVSGSSSDDSVVSYNNGTLTALKEGTATITIKTSSAPDYAGVLTAQFDVVVNKLASQNAPSLTGVSVNKAKPSNKVVSNPANAIFDTTLYKADSSRPSGYSVIKSNESGYGDILVSSSGQITYVRNSGTVYVRAYIPGVANKSNPSTYTYVPVNYGQQAVDTELNVDTQPIVLDVKDTKQISATASTGSSISYTSADPTVASVDANGLVTANKSGYTTVTVTATAPDGKTGDSAIITVIVRGSETITDDTVKPAKVTGLKVSNKKGAHVSVKWKSQGKNINYRIWKKVGNGKWVGKNVAGSKATLSVKKGAKVQVKVKAYVKDANGKTTWGPKATKAKTFKTDKK